MSLKRRIHVHLKPTEISVLRATGLFKNDWGDLKFVYVERHGKLSRLFYDPEVKA